MSYLVPASVKQATRRRLVEQHGAKTVTYQALAIFVSIVVRPHWGSIQRLVIDRDYTGDRAQGTIKNVLLHLLRREMPTVTTGFIQFANVKECPLCAASIL